MHLFHSDKKEEKPQESSNEPPLYDQLQQQHLGEAPQYENHGDPNEYPQEKQDGPPNQGNQQGVYTIPQNTYLVAPQSVNIAYETDGKYTRPGYKEYLQHDQQRVAQGDLPKPREAFKHGAPLNEGSGKNPKAKSSGFPGSGGPTYYNSSQK